VEVKDVGNLDAGAKLGEGGTVDGFSSSLLYFSELTEEGVTELVRDGEGSAERQVSEGSKVSFGA